MDDNSNVGFLLTASAGLKAAYAQESLNPKYALNPRDPQLALRIASEVKRNHPEAFDLSNPGDSLVWAFASE